MNRVAAVTIWLLYIVLDIGSGLRASTVGGDPDISTTRSETKCTENESFMSIETETPPKKGIILYPNRIPFSSEDNSVHSLSDFNLACSLFSRFQILENSNNEDSNGSNTECGQANEMSCIRCIKCRTARRVRLPFTGNDSLQWLFSQDQDITGIATYSREASGPSCGIKNYRFSKDSSGNCVLLFSPFFF